MTRIAWALAFALAAEAVARAGEDAAREAADAYRAGDFDRAVERFDDAAARAYRDGATGLALDYALAAAETERTRGRDAEAAGRFRRAALAAGSDPRADDAHWSACLAAGAAWRGASGDAEPLRAYRALLEEHALSWPEAPTADEARWRIVELLAAERRWRELFAAASVVPTGDSRRGRADRLLVIACAGLTDEAIGSGPEAIDRAALEATEALLPLVLDERKRWPAAWNPLGREAALVVARVHLARGREGAAYAVPLLRTSLAGAPPPDEAWRRRALSHLAVSLVATGDPRGAAEWLHDPRGEGLGERLVDAQRAAEIVRGIESRVASPAGDRWPAEADRVERTLASPGRDAQGAAPDRRGGVAEAPPPGAGPGEEAELAILRERAQRSPSAASLAALAEKLGRSGSSARREEALGVWRSIELGSPRGGPRWREARARRIDLLVGLGRAGEAAKLRGITRLLQPGERAPASGTEAPQ